MALREHPTLVRFDRWVKEQGSATAAAEAIKRADPRSVVLPDGKRTGGCTDVMVGYITSGKQLPGRQLAHIIERATADWSGGQVRAEEWDSAENERDDERKRAGNGDAAEPTRAA